MKLYSNLASISTKFHLIILSDDSMLDDDVPNSAVDLINKDRFLKKSLRIERVAEEVKLVLKPHYNKKHVTKEEYKEILRKAVPKVNLNSESISQN